MISKEEKQILKAYRKLKEYGAKNIALVDADKYEIKDFKKADWEVLCEECSSAAKEAGLTKEDSRRILEEYRTIERKAMEYDTLIKERDYYKARYNEFNDYFLKNNMTIEQMLKELKRSKLYERSTEDDKDKMRHMQRRGNETKHFSTIQKEDRLL